MVNFRRKLRHSMIDQESLEPKVTEWKQLDKEVKIFFRPKSNDQCDAAVRSSSDYGKDDSDSEDSVDYIVDGDYKRQLLFVYQNSSQRRLLNRYGNELALLDATYRTTRYALPLFFLVVRTNVDYQVVGTFVCESETTGNIEEALRIVKEWNPEFEPKYFMTDYSSEEIAAIENTFQGSKINNLVVFDN